MTAVFAARRRAEEFAALVDGPSTRARRPADQRRAARTSSTAAARDAARGTPRPEFVGDLRERLMAEADTVLRPGPATAATAPEPPG